MPGLFDTCFQFLHLRFQNLLEIGVGLAGQEWGEGVRNGGAFSCQGGVVAVGEILQKSSTVFVEGCALTGWRRGVLQTQIACAKEQGTKCMFECRP